MSESHDPNGFGFLDCLRSHAVRGCINRHPQPCLRFTARSSSFECKCHDQARAIIQILQRIWVPWSVRAGLRHDSNYGHRYFDVEGDPIYPRLREGTERPPWTTIKGGRPQTFPNGRRVARQPSVLEAHHKWLNLLIGHALGIGGNDHPLDDRLLMDVDCSLGGERWNPLTAPTAEVADVLVAIRAVLDSASESVGVRLRPSFLASGSRGLWIVLPLSQPVPREWLVGLHGIISDGISRADVPVAMEPDVTSTSRVLCRVVWSRHPSTGMFAEWLAPDGSVADDQIGFLDSLPVTDAIGISGEGGIGTVSHPMDRTHESPDSTHLGNRDHVPPDSTHEVDRKHDSPDSTHEGDRDSENIMLRAVDEHEHVSPDSPSEDSPDSSGEGDPDHEQILPMVVDEASQDSSDSSDPDHDSPDSPDWDGGNPGPPGGVPWHREDTTTPTTLPMYRVLIDETPQDSPDSSGEGDRDSEQILRKVVDEASQDSPGSSDRHGGNPDSPGGARRHEDTTTATTLSMHTVSTDETSQVSPDSPGSARLHEDDDHHHTTLSMCRVFGASEPAERRPWLLDDKVAQIRAGRPHTDVDMTDWRNILPAVITNNHEQLYQRKTLHMAMAVMERQLGRVNVEALVAEVRRRIHPTRNRSAVQRGVNSILRRVRGWIADLLSSGDYYAPGPVKVDDLRWCEAIVDDMAARYRGRGIRPDWTRVLRVLEYLVVSGGGRRSLEVSCHRMALALGEIPYGTPEGDSISRAAIGRMRASLRWLVDADLRHAHGLSDPVLTRTMTGFKSMNGGRSHGSVYTWQTPPPSVAGGGHAPRRRDAHASWLASWLRHAMPLRVVLTPAESLVAVIGSGTEGGQFLEPVATLGGRPLFRLGGTVAGSHPVPEALPTLGRWLTAGHIPTSGLVPRVRPPFVPARPSGIPFPTTPAGDNLRTSCP